MNPAKVALLVSHLYRFDPNKLVWITCEIDIDKVFADQIDTIQDNIGEFGQNHFLEWNKPQEAPVVHLRGRAEDCIRFLCNLPGAFFEQIYNIDSDQLNVENDK